MQQISSRRASSLPTAPHKAHISTPRSLAPSSTSLRSSQLPLLRSVRPTDQLLLSRSRTSPLMLKFRRGAPAQQGMVADLEVSQESDLLPPAVLPGTPNLDEEFPISSERLIELAKSLFKEGEGGVKDPSLLSDDFRFEFPVISLAKAEYIKAVSSFKIKDAFPDIQPHAYDFRVDPYERNRVWFTTRVTATHLGELKFGKSVFKPTKKVVYGAPECASYIFNAEGKCTSYTGGYVMDRRVGNTQGLGALFGIIAAIGGPVLKPGSLLYTLLMMQSAVGKFFGGLFDTLTFGMFKKKPEAATA